MKHFNFQVYTPNSRSTEMKRTAWLIIELADNEFIPLDPELPGITGGETNKGLIFKITFLSPMQDLLTFVHTIELGLCLVKGATTTFISANLLCSMFMNTATDHHMSQLLC